MDGLKFALLSSLVLTNFLDILNNKVTAQSESATCHDTTVIDYATRLIGCDGKTISSQAGRLEIYYKDGWGTVCSDNFDKFDAQVACYSLGYLRNQGLFTGDAFPNADNPVRIVLDDVACHGNETALDACVHAEWTNHNCFHDEDVTIACAVDESNPANRFGYVTRLVNDVDENVTNAGRIEIYHRGEWGTVCDDGWDIESEPSFIHNARVACLALGQGFKVGRFQRNEYGRGTGRIWLDTINCSSVDLNIGNCAHEPWGVHDCNHDEDVSVYCAKCLDEFCENGASCVDEDTEQCLCVPGYYGTFCEHLAKDCTEGFGCYNGGSCLYEFTQFRCRCPPGYTGKYCETYLGRLEEDDLETI